MSKPTLRPRRLGLTGGMGCGKSTAAGFFRELGFGIVESDAIVRELWESDAEVKNAAIHRWGQKIVTPQKEENPPTGKNGSPLPAPCFPLIDRRKVAEIVFADPRELDWLESLLHPIVRNRWQASLAANPEKDWVVEIPLLFEKNLASEFDFTLCIASSPAQQAARLAARGLSPVELAARRSRQWPLSKKIEQADFVALNDGSLDFLRQEIVYLATQLTHSAP